MSHVALGSLGYGSANLGNLYRAISDEQAWLVLEAAWDAGIRYFDTAPHYGLGLAERRLGAFLATKPRDEFVLSTKVGRLLRSSPETAHTFDDANQFVVPADLRRVWDFTPDGIRRSLDESLERLGLDAVDVLFLHDPEQFDLDEAERSAYPTLAALRDEGLVHAVGAGSMSVQALQRAADAPELDFVMIAGRLTLAEQPVSSGVLPSCRLNDSDVVAAGVFNSGLLASDDPRSARYEYGAVPPSVAERVERIAVICANHGVPLPTAALQYPLRVDRVRAVVVGSSRPEQIAQNASRMNAALPEALWDELREAGLLGGITG